MPIYRYKAVNSKGKSVHGQVISYNDEAAENRVNSLGLEIVWITDITDNVLNRFWLWLQKIKTRDLVIFSRQFSLLVSSNVGMVEALATVQEQTENIKLRSILAEVTYEVDGGALLSEALRRKGGRTFSAFFINVIHAGETSGKLDEVLNYLADEMEKDFDLTSKFKGAMIYPTIVLTGLVGVGFVMMLFVMPQLTAILQETGAQLPWATRVVIWAVDFLQKYFIFIVIFIILCVVGLRFFVRSEYGRMKVDYLKLNIPAVGKLFRLVYLIRFCRAFSTLLRGGVSLVKSLEISADIVRNKVYQKLIMETIDQVNEGSSVSSVFITSREIPKMIPQMMAIGEKTGNLDNVLEKISVFYSRELAAKLNNLGVILEPLIMIILAVGVGIMVAAIILPMYNVATSF
ncbi:MAG: type II secretion system F family protein [Patescibacteria group bacterium]